MLFFAPNKKIIACTLTFENYSFCKGANTVSKIVCVCVYWNIRADLIDKLLRGPQN
jgi:hypothetical protein